MSPHYGPGTPAARTRTGQVCVHSRVRGWIIDGMQGILVVLVPVLLAGFALLMDRFENTILEEPEQIDS